MAKDNQWLDWLKCNILEIVILVLVLVLLVKVYSAPAVESAKTVTGEVALEEPLAENGTLKVPTLNVAMNNPKSRTAISL